MRRPRTGRHHDAILVAADQCFVLCSRAFLHLSLNHWQCDRTSIEAQIARVLGKRFWTIGAVAGHAACLGQRKSIADEGFMQDVRPLAVSYPFPGAFGPGVTPSGPLVVLNAFV